MPIPNGTEDRAGGMIPGRPGRSEPRDRASGFALWFAVVVIWLVAAIVAGAGLYALAWWLLHS